MHERAESYEKAQELADVHGYDAPEDFIVECGMDSIVPGICMNVGCDNEKDVEPDCENGHCEKCGTDSIDSIHVMLGII